jgi:NAD(P)-dependent dehydrogenase (short-subunit alcohol dehydrogenase family)
MIALVTGSSTGIGAATAITLARAGHTVYAGMRKPEAADAKLKASGAQPVPLDVDSDASVAAAFTKPIDVLVNNAGVAVFGAIEDLPLEEFRRMMETNYFGALRCIKAAIPAMRERRSGCIINVTSVAGKIAGGAQAGYSASKWALEALSDSLASEVRGFGVRVAVVEPGVIATPIFTKAPPEKPTVYPHLRRLNALFQASLKSPTSPYVVAEIIRGIVESDSWQVRYPAGPDAAGSMASRAAMSDEDWASIGALSDADWKTRIEKARGVEIDL